ncbi:hypothetical protein HYN69_02450 [Gemmobacter aquarius]|uniref:Uncharacterized protein n=1 Tax=Paragemmobacter aquarius TaxID=2169400 RepID=A0A2S0UI85_9RHOB|nr:DUF6389 family protein [Gemmobacter aquarius]AWB47519.1 hypothetical protein HYN69_02450 [Gemmobacter aquarius]
MRGPDLFAHNKAIADVRCLFELRFLQGVVTPDVPLFDPFDQAFGVNDVIVDMAMVWFGEVWAAFGGMGRRLPVTMAGEDGFGLTPPLSPGD